MTMSDTNNSELSKAFIFDSSFVDHALSDTELQLEAFRERIEKIARELAFGDPPFPILLRLVELAPDGDYLSKLGKALEHIASMVDTCNQLEQRKQVLKLASEDFPWFASSFGDFSYTIPDTLQLGDLDGSGN